MTRIAMIVAAALAAPAATLPASSAEAGERSAVIQLQNADFSLGLRFGNGFVIYDDRDRFVHRDFKPVKPIRKKFREERVERRLEGRFVGQTRRDIRFGLRDLGFRNIDIDRRGRGFDVLARRNGRDFAFRVGRRSGRILAAERF
ncbi:MAG: hypothetical protein AAF899_02390 [Pseudomonadota bacterium]